MFSALFLWALLGAGDAPPTAELQAPPSDAECLPIGVCSKVIQPGDASRKVEAGQWVTLHYQGWTLTGECFEDTRAQGFSVTRPLKEFLKGIQVGVRLMCVGEKRRIWVPESLAFGGAMGKPKGQLVLDVEVIDASPAPSVPPPDLKEPGPGAVFLPSGLTYRVLRKGLEGKPPGRGAHVTVAYTGWTQDGQMFDSSLERRTPSTFQLGDVIKGWREMLRLMHRGDKVRVWIPEKLAYKGQEGKPSGPLVFDIELCAFWE